MGLLVAKSVKVGKGTGANQHTKVSENSETTKISLAAFAQKAGIDDKTVKKYLDAWNAASLEGYVEPSDALNPDDEPEYLNIDKLPSWKGYFQPRKQRETNDKTKETKETKTDNTTKETTTATDTVTDTSTTTDVVEDDNLDDYEEEFDRADSHSNLNSQTRPTNSFVTYNEKCDSIINTLLGTMFDIHDQYPAKVVSSIKESSEQYDSWIEKLEMTHRALGTYINTLKETK